MCTGQSRANSDLVTEIRGRCYALGLTPPGRKAITARVRLLRLANRLQVSLHTLASYSFGIEDRSGRTRWWCRPHPWVLARIGERTGVNVARLRPIG
jgi:hypothetical protein